MSEDIIPVHEEYNGLKLRFSAIRKKHRPKKKNASQKWVFSVVESKTAMYSKYLG